MDSMDSQAIFSLLYLPMTITLVALEDALLPDYLGSTLRGVVGQALRGDPSTLSYLYCNRKVNVNQRNTPSDIPSDIPSDALSDTPSDTLKDTLKDTLNPYIIIPPPINNAVYQKGDILSFDMLLLGDAISYVRPLVDALCTMRQFGLGACRRRFLLVKITHSKDQRVIWQNGRINTVALQSVALPCRKLWQVTGLSVRLLTPLRIRRNGVMLETIDFPVIIRNIVRRITAITERYGGWVDQNEGLRLLAYSTQVETLEKALTLKRMKRYSNRRGESMDCSGLIGRVDFVGDLTPFVPWLYAAEILHIGRNTTFGLGQIAVEFV